ncbi:MAG: HAD family hydrolase [Planctomycetota bacterium]|jgi:phosphoserine phosphatase
MQAEKLDVFDFDGTLIKVNSFREVTKIFTIMLVKKLKMIPILALAFWYILRRARIIAHLAFKQHVVEIFEQTLSEQEKRSVCQSVFIHNLNKSMLERFATSENCIICTASPYAYMSRISFDKVVPVISALDPEGKFPDKANFGPGKIENLNAYFSEKRICVMNFFTDNSDDDRPLIDFAENAFVVKGDYIMKIK